MMLKHKEYEDKKKASKTTKENANPNSKKNKWKKQSEEFRAILRENRTVTTSFGRKKIIEFNFF